MIKIENYEVFGWEAAIRGMRNPMNSWDKSDSGWTTDGLKEDDIFIESDWEGWQELRIGPVDQDLMLRLAKAGSVEGKFRRMITVYLDITAPLYWWKEFDTYKVGTVANSCSTMHKIHEKEFTLDDFSHEHLMGFPGTASLFSDDGTFKTDTPFIELLYPGTDSHIDSPDYMMTLIVKMLNVCRENFLETKDKRFWWQMIQLLPSSYNQRRTVMLNYEVLSNIYQNRRNHKLDEWREFCSWIEELPFSEIITCNVKE